MPQSAWLVLARQKKDEGRQCTARSAGKFLGKARKVCPGDKKSLLNPDFLVWAAYYGNVNVVRMLLAVDGIEVNKRDRNSFTALMHARDHGHRGVMRELQRRPQ